MRHAAGVLRGATAGFGIVAWSKVGLNGKSNNLFHCIWDTSVWSLILLDKGDFSF
jgi:hypothetical protein